MASTIHIYTPTPLRYRSFPRHRFNPLTFPARTPKTLNTFLIRRYIHAVDLILFQSGEIKT